jgi:hypothetical protein
MTVLVGTILSGIAGVLALDTVGSTAAKRVGFAYARLVPVQAAIYGALGAYAALALSVRAALIAGAAVAAFDVTVGWAISWQIGPGRLPAELAHPSRVIVTGLYVMALFSFVAVAAGFGATLIVGTT